MWRHGCESKRTVCFLSFIIGEDCCKRTQQGTCGISPTAQGLEREVEAGTKGISELFSGDM